MALSIFITAVASLLCSVPAWSDGTLSCMKCLNVEDGLSQSMVYCIHQDSRGFMWFGTQDGLNRYDGHEIVVFRRNPDDPQSVGSDNYFTIFENDDHKLWLGTFNGVFIYDPRLEKFTFFDAHTEEGKAVGARLEASAGIVREMSGSPARMARCSDMTLRVDLWNSILRNYSAWTPLCRSISDV